MIVVVNLVKYLLTRLNKNRIHVLLVGEDELIDKIKKV